TYLPSCSASAPHGGLTAQIWPKLPCEHTPQDEPGPTWLGLACLLLSTFLRGEPARSRCGGWYRTPASFLERNQHDEDAFPAGAVVRRLRRWRRRALPDEPRGALVLVPDLARTASRAGRGLEAHRRSAAPPQV